VADYRPDHAADHKLKKQGDEGMTLHLVQNPDILATLGGMKRDDQRLIGFALETNDELDNARKKLQKKNFDFIVLNSLQDEGAGFQHDTNKITIVSATDVKAYPLKPKTDVARDIIDQLVQII
jgi:phosphopantothenoylcysteine decarboxylase/phosphopantothenate--cysteine ligase